MMNKTSSSSSDDDEEDDADDDDDDERKEQQKKKKKKNTTRKASPNNAKQPQQPQAPMSRQQKELAKLAPWAWDPLVSRHAPGPSALRDFSEVLPSSEVKHKARVTMTPTASRPALKPTTVSLTGSAKNKKAEKEKENVAPSPTFSKNIGTTTAKKSSNTTNTKALPSGGGAKRKAAENNPKMQGGDASVANNTNDVVATKKARKNATNATTSAENVATSTKKEEEKLEKEKEAPATAIVTKKRSTIAGSRGKKDAAATATTAAEEPKTAPQKRTQKSEQITPVAFELEPASGTESKNLKKSAAAATATSDTVVPTTGAKGARGKKALATTATPVVRAKKKLNLQTPGATVENNNETKAFVVDSAAVAEAKQTPLTKKRKKSNSPGSKTGAKETKVDPSALVPPEFQQRQLTPEERKERRDKFWVYLETIKVKPPKESAPLLKETMPSHRLYQSFCFATGRITPDVVKTTTTTIPTATTKGGFVRVTSSSSLDEDALARRVRLVPMSRSLRMAVSALK